MRFLVIVLALAINVALVKVDCQSTDDGYTYTITATRTENVMAPGYPIAYMYYQVTPTQNITYFVSIGPTNPLWIESYIYNDDDEIYFSNDELLNSCEKQPNDTWQFVLREVVRKSVLLGGDCSVDKGSYMIDQIVDPITVTFPEMIKCGQADLIFNAFASSNGQNSGSPMTWGFQLSFNLQIEGICI